MGGRRGKGKVKRESEESEESEYDSMMGERDEKR